MRPGRKGGEVEKVEGGGGNGRLYLYFLMKHLNIAIPRFYLDV